MGQEAANGVDDGNGFAGGPLPVSLCMIVRNEGRFLADCLRSAAAFVTEMIVVDTGSTDGTAAIAEAGGARVIHTAWTDDFAAVRNLSLAAASQSWILVLDADEQLIVTDAAAWQALLADTAKQGYFVQVISRVGSGAHAGTVTDAVCRLFRRDERIRFRGLVHEEAASAIGEAFGAEAVGYAAGLEIRHEGYRDDVIAERDKFARNRRLLERALEAAPDNPGLRYAAGAELFACGDYAAALVWLEPLAELAHDPGYGSDLLLKVVHACRAVGRLGDAARYAAICTKRHADFADAHEARSEVLLALDEPVSALRCIDEALRAGPAPIWFSTAAGAGTYRAFGLAGAALERMYRFREAAEAYVSAIALRPDYAPAWQRLLLLGRLDVSLRPLWLKAAEGAALRHGGIREAAGGEKRVETGLGAEAGKKTGMAARLSWLGDGFAEWLLDLRLPEEAAALWSRAHGGAERLQHEGTSPGALAEGIWLVQRGEAERGRQVWEAAYDAGNADAERLALYGFALALGEGDTERARIALEQQPGGAFQAAARAALAAFAGAERAMPQDAASGAIARALLRLGAVPAWLRLHAAAAPAAPARTILRAVPPLLLAALLQGAPPALRAALAAGGAGLPPAAAAPHRLAAGWAAAAGGDWRAAAEDLAAARTEGARPWQRRAASAGLAAAGAAIARAAGGPGPGAGANLPALYSEAALPLILGTAMLPPG
ncbi:glycosyltransferase [Paenibacillus sacheonensis]|uniref:glycosyltransferase n=2 Tax=Paenibacillus sacheonensis TaxID=742054 RepID=UPI001EF9257E|nr:glycosyltransferase [Paenibacillus sacheonensis]